MNPYLGLFYGALAVTVSLATLAVYACLVAAKRADQQASRLAIPVRSENRRRNSRAYRRN